MENTIYSDELQHWGIKGQKWGVRRYQNKDGSLTPAGQKRYNKEMEKLKAEEAKIKAAEKVAATRKKTQAKIDKLDAKRQELAERKKKLKVGDVDSDETPAETPEERKAQLLNSTNPKELYKNKDLFTYQELNERVNRIDLEMRLQGKIPAEEGFTDRMGKAAEKVDNVLKAYKTVDNTVSTVANSYIGKTLAKQLGIELPKKETKFDINDFWKNRDKKSTQEMLDADKRTAAEDRLKGRLDARKKASDAAKAEAAAEKSKTETLKNAQKQVEEAYDEYVRGTNTSSTYSKKGRDVVQDDLSDGVKNEVAVYNNRSMSSFSSDTVSRGKSLVDNSDFDGTMTRNPDGSYTIEFDLD